MFSRWVFWDASGWVFYIDIFKSGNLEGSSPEREVSADREGRSCLSDSCCEASVIQGENSEGLHKGNLFLPFPPSPWLYCCCSSFFLSVFSSSSLMFLVWCFSHQIQLSAPWWNSLLGLNNWLRELIFTYFFSAELLRAEQCFHYSSALCNIVYQVIYFKKPEFGLMRKPWYGSQFCVWCLLPRVFWHPVTLMQSCRRTLSPQRILVLNSTEDTLSLVQYRHWSHLIIFLYLSTL